MSIIYRNYVVTKVIKQDEIIIIGGKEELSLDEIKELAKLFGIADYKLNLFVQRGAERGNQIFEFYSYTLSYGPKSYFYNKAQREYKYKGYLCRRQIGKEQIVVYGGTELLSEKDLISIAILFGIEEFYSFQFKCRDQESTGFEFSGYQYYLVSGQKSEFWNRAKRENRKYISSKEIA